MKICIIGYSGFLGSYILKKLSKKFFIIKINLREMPEFDDKNFKNFLNKFNKSNIIINCAAALKPRSKRDFFINQDFPKTLSLHMKKRKKKFLFIHMSTINVLIKDRKDSYTISKRIAEKKFWPGTCMQSAQSLTSLYAKKVYFSVFHKLQEI